MYKYIGYSNEAFLTCKCLIFNWKFSMLLYASVWWVKTNIYIASVIQVAKKREGKMLIDIFCWLCSNIVTCLKRSWSFTREINKDLKVAWKELKGAGYGFCHQIVL